MPDFRAYCQPSAADPEEIRLSPEESHHLVTVNRCSRGDPVIAFDGRGHEWLTECVEAGKTAARLRVKGARPAAIRTFSITLAQALPKGSTMDEIVRQATEVGAGRIVPLLSARTQVHLDGDRADKKVEKWRTTAIEAAKQCGNPWLPEITPVMRFDEFIAKDWPSIPVGPKFGEGRSAATAGGGAETDAPPLKLIASLHAGTTTLKKALAVFARKHDHAPRSALWLIGPEGDFSPAEMTAAISAGFVPVTLGPLVLRSDTAALYALSILSDELGS